MVKYFIREGDKNIGPFTLPELIERQIRPSDYVWCKGMDDWEKAEDVADICRAMRLRLAGLPIPGQKSTTNTNSVTTRKTTEKDQGNPLGLYSFQEPPKDIDYNIKPSGISIVMAIVCTICCFPVTGLVAIWLAVKFESLWKKSESQDISPDQRLQYRKAAYEQARLYRMLIGITISLAVITYGYILSLKF